MKRMIGSLRVGFPAVAILGAISALAAIPAVADYGFFRTVDGSAALIQGDTGASVEVEANYPVLLGDRVEVSREGRVEAVLADGNYLRVAGDTELVFEREGSATDTGTASTLRLERGEIQLVLPADSETDEPLRIDTVNATIYVEARGSYRIYSDGRGWTEVVVREGWAEVLTERGSSVVRSGEQSTINGTRWPRVTLRAAGGLDELEIWGGELLASAHGTASPYVDPRLGYASAPLARHGSWLYVGGRHAWRPAVETGWRPYHYGRWGYTPAGLSWISPEPWGWVTYHYGYWDLAGGVGWVWYPGRAYTTAAVYWYWGPTHVAWVPRGYYDTFYTKHSYRYGSGLYPGVHGWAGGSISHWSNWTFCATGRFGGRGGYRYYSTGDEMTRSGRLSVVPRGVITTDTREITPNRWHRPAEVMGVLTRNDPGRVSGDSHRGSFPDLTAWVARSSKLPSDTAAAMYGDSRSSAAPLPVSARSTRGTPFSPAPRATASPFDLGRGRAGAGASVEPGRPTSDSAVAPVPSGRRLAPSRRGTWSREPGDWIPRRSGEANGATDPPRIAAPRDLVRGGVGAPLGFGADETARSRFDRSGAGVSPDGRDTARDWRGMPTVQPPTGPSAGAASTPPVRKVVDGMKNLRDRGRPGSSGRTPSRWLGSGASAGSRPASGLTRGGSESGTRGRSSSTRGSASTRSNRGTVRGSARGSGGGSSSRSTRGSGGGG